MNCRTLIATVLMMPLCTASFSQTVNYDESKVTPYVLEDPLTFVDGRPVETIKDWEARRAEILEIFQNEMYGRMPEKSPFTLEEIEHGGTMAGYAVRKQVRMRFSGGQTIDWLILYPTGVSGPVPAVISLNYDGNHTIIKDKEVLIDESVFAVDGDILHERGYGHGENTLYPVEMILARGAAFVTACYLDVSPDPNTPQAQADHAYTGIFSLWGERDGSCENNTTSLTAWAWALCRGLDMLETDSRIDASRVMVTGCSRLAKAALIAGAYDERFAVVAPVQTGGGGVPLAKRNFGENITTETRQFTHWYCKAYGKYAGHEDMMPFDQHLFCACVAPRPLIVGGFNEGWFDAKGEFLSLQAASPVWEKFCGSGLPRVAFPDNYSTSAIGRHLGYYRRENRHGIYAFDWIRMMDFAAPALRLDADPVGIIVTQSGEAAYAEVQVSEFLVPDSPWEEFRKRLDSTRVKAIVADGLLPEGMKMSDTARVSAYVTETMKRAKEAGIGTIVLSGREREASRQCGTLRTIGQIAGRYGVTVVLETGSVRDGIALVRKINDPNIRLAADLGRMVKTGEDAGAILEAGDLLQYCRITEGDGYGPYLKALKGISYRGPISVENGSAAEELKRQISYTF